MKDPSRMILLGAMFLLLYVYFILVLLTNEKCERAWKTGADSAEDDILIVERYRYANHAGWCMLYEVVNELAVALMKTMDNNEKKLGTSLCGR